MSDGSRWLAGLTSGQPVAVVNTFGHVPTVAVGRVERVTATQVVVDGLRFYRDTGRRLGRGSDMRLAPLDDPEALRAWAQRQVALADAAIDGLFKQWRDNRLDAPTVLRLAREALDRASHAQNARRLPEPAPVATEGHDDPPGEEI